MRKTYSYDKVSIRNTDLYYQVEGGDVWYQCSGISRILDLSAGSKLAASAAVQNNGRMVQQILWPLSIVDTLEAGFFRQ